MDANSVKHETSEVTPLISIIIVNFNGKRFLSKCLESIGANVPVPHEIILVDNASSDGSYEFISQQYPELKCIRNLRNVGFAQGNNIGAKSARGKYLLLLNNDTIISGSVAPMVKMMESKQEVGVAGCRLTYGSGLLQETIGYFPTAMSVVLSWTALGGWFPRRKIFRQTASRVLPCYDESYVVVDWVSGACLLTRRELWEQLGGFDDNYFMYMEEVDYCLRAHKAKHRVAYTNSCSVVHFEGGGRPWIGTNALLATVDSYRKYFLKFHGRATTSLMCGLLCLVFVARSMVYFALFLTHRGAIYSDKCRAYGIASANLARGMFSLAQ